MRIQTLLTTFLMCPFIVCTAGMLDDFESDVDFLAKTYPEVKKAGVKSVFRNEYRTRLTMATDRAHRIQMSAQKLGIPRITLQSTMMKLNDAVQVKGVSTGGLGKGSGTVAEHAAELQRQIKQLRKLNYSYESESFENPYPDSGTYEAVNHYNNMLRVIYRDAIRKRTMQKTLLNSFGEKCTDFKKLGQNIAHKVVLDKIKVPGDFNLTAHMDAFLQNAYKLCSMRVIRNNENIKTVIKSRNYTDLQKSLEYAATRLEADIDFLKRSKFSMRIRKHDLQPIYQKLKESKDEIDGSKPQLSYNELWKLYTKTKNDIFNSENKRRGVSEQFYKRYRAMLTAKQKKELDSVMKKHIAEELSPELSRSMAVKKIHTLYQYKQNAYSKEELERILRNSGALK